MLGITLTPRNPQGPIAAGQSPSWAWSWLNWRSEMVEIHWVWLVAGGFGLTLVGVVLGMMTLALCVIAGRTDDALERAGGGQDGMAL